MNGITSYYDTRHGPLLKDEPLSKSIRKHEAAQPAPLKGISNFPNKRLSSSHLKEKPYKKAKIHQVAKPVILEDISNSPNKRPAPLTAEKKLTKSRKILDVNQAASLAYWENLGQSSMEHGTRRVEFFFVTRLALFKKAVRTDKPPTDVKVWVDHASMQVGQGTNKMHAAHSNAAAGLSDDLKQCWIDQVVAEGLSPNKKAVLLNVRKVSPEDIDALEERHSEEAFVKQIFDLYWPEGSLIKGTKLEFRLNATIQLPKDLNLGCDKDLERALRPEIAKLIKQVMMGVLDPRKATEQYVGLVEAHFSKQLTYYYNKLEALSATDFPDVEEMTKYQRQILFNQKELNGTGLVNYDALEKDFLAPTSTPEVPVFDLEKTFDIFD